jgi:hypothetical protein
MVNREVRAPYRTALAAVDSSDSVAQEVLSVGAHDDNVRSRGCGSPQDPIEGIAGDDQERHQTPRNPGITLTCSLRIRSASRVSSATSRSP